MYQPRQHFRNARQWVDIIHVVLSVVITVMAAFAFVFPEENKMLFPLIFFCMAIVRLSSGIYLLAEGRKEHKFSVAGAVDLALGLLLLLLGTVSAVSIWR